MLEYFLVMLGIISLVKGADWLISGSTTIAKQLKISELIIGLTIVAFGTSLPELMVTILSAFKGAPSIALGNIIGSNISNLLLILGISAIISPIIIKKPTIKTDIPFSIIATIILFVTIISFKEINFIIGIGFLIIFLAYIYSRLNLFKKIKIKEESKKNHKTILLIILGSFALFLGGRLTVDSIIKISKNLGLSEFLISATIIALGTSLPELVTSIKATLKKQSDLVIGNIIGSNIFNILWVLGSSSLLKPIALSRTIIPDILFLGFASLLFSSFLAGKNRIDKPKGIIMLILYFIYVSFIIFRG